MTRYHREIDRLIVNELNRTGSSLMCTELHGISKKTRYATVWEHLTRLRKAGIIEKSRTPGRNNETYYSLTPAAKLQLEYDILEYEGVESKREDPARREETQERKYRKILTLLLLQAANGSSRWNVLPKAEAGAVTSYDRKTGKIVPLGLYHEKGVTVMDIVERRDYSNAGLFSHVNFDKSDVEKCYDKFKSEYVGLSNIMKIRLRENVEIECSIHGDSLHNLIMSYSCLLGGVFPRIEETLKLAILKSYNLLRSFPSAKSIKQQGKFIRQAFEWYMSSFGRNRLNSLYAKMRVQKTRYLLENEDTFRRLYAKASNDQLNEGLSAYDMYDRLYEMIAEEGNHSNRLQAKKWKKREAKLKEEKYIQELEKRINAYDRFILHTYHCRVLCDKYEEGLPKEYYDSIRSLSYRYSGLIREIIVDFVYPRFLRKEHEHNLELFEYVNSLPAISDELLRHQPYEGI